MITSKPNLNKNNDNEITKAIQSHKLKRFYADLVKNEKSINWLAYAAKLYRKSHSIDTPLNYMKSACIFRKYLLENANGQTLAQFIEAAKNDAEMLYETLDNFVTYCDAQRDFMPRTTRSHFYNTVEVLKYCKVKIDDQELSQIRLPDPKVLRDEYPSDDEIKRIDENARLTVRAFRRVLNDTGFDPVDIAQRKVKDFNFNESPTRLSIDREKTGEPLTGFLTQITSDTAKLLIDRKHLQPDDYLFCEKFTTNTVQNLRDDYNLACARAGMQGYTLVRDKNGQYRGTVGKIEGHSFGKYHLKVYKKRFFTLAISAGVPEFVVQGMLGRKKYLDEYMRLPLDKKQEFAKQIHAKVDTHAPKVDKQEVIKKASELLGVAVDEDTINALKAITANYRKLPESDKARLLGFAQDIGETR